MPAVQRASLAEADAGSSQARSHLQRRGWRWLAAVGVVTYALALLATLPARLVVPRTDIVQDVAGTVWEGSAALTGGHALRWYWSPLGSLGSGSVAADWTLDGPNTALTGVGHWRPGSANVDEVAGRAGWALVGLAAPALPLTCDTVLTLRHASGAADRFAGEVGSTAGHCGPRGTVPVAPVQRLLGLATDDGRLSRLSLTPWSARNVSLVDVTLSRDRTLIVAITAAGAAQLGGTVPPRGATMEMQL